MLRNIIKEFFTKCMLVLTGNNGSSFVGVLMMSGLVAGIALIGATMTKNMNQGQVRIESKLEDLDLRRQILTVLTDKAACANTFSGVNIGGAISGIKNSSGTLIFQVGQTYGNGSLKINSLTTSDLNQTYPDGTRIINLSIGLKKLKSQTKLEKNSVIQLRVKATSATAPITSCFGDYEQLIKTACLSAGGTWNGSDCSYDALYVKDSGDTMTGNLTAVQFNGDFSGTNATFASSLTVGIATLLNRFTSPVFCTGTNCKAMGDFALSNRACPGGQVIDGIKPDGTPRCRLLQCPSNEYFAGLDISSNPVCRPNPTKTCPTNQYVAKVNPNGTVECEILPNNAISLCPSGMVMQSLYLGVPVCVDSLQAICLSEGGTWNGSSCSYHALYVLKSGDTMTGNLTATQFNGNIYGTTGVFSNFVYMADAAFATSITSPLFCTGGNCKAIGDLALSARSCPLGQVSLGFKSDGTPNCRPLQCSAGLYFAGLDGAGSAVCRPYPTKNCPTNQYVASVNADGTVNCGILPNNAISTCPAGQVLQSVNAGIPTCVNKGPGTSCASGQRITAIAADGSVTCSTPPLPITGTSCPSGQVVTGLASNGTVTCTIPSTNVAGGSCPGGQLLSGVNTNGSPICTRYCAGGTASWTQGGNTCSATISAGSIGAIKFLTDGALPNLGSGSATCTTSGWSATGSCSSGCVGATLSWVSGAETCSAYASGVNYGSSISISDTTAPATGSATASCSPSGWSASGSCTVPVGSTGCANAGQSVSWTVGGNTCSATLPSYTFPATNGTANPSLVCDTVNESYTTTITSANGGQASVSCSLEYWLYCRNTPIGTAAWGSPTGISCPPAVIPVPGACGSSNGTSSVCAPTTGLCNAGSASAVSGSGPWSWTCYGTNGGSNASCSAFLAPSDCPCGSYLTGFSSSGTPLCAY